MQFLCSWYLDVDPFFLKPLLMADQGKSLGGIGNCNCIDSNGS